jgi:hypothetical protein
MRPVSTAMSAQTVWLARLPDHLATRIDNACENIEVGSICAGFGVVLETKGVGVRRGQYDNSTLRRARKYECRGAQRQVERRRRLL